MIVFMSDHLDVDLCEYLYSFPEWGTHNNNSNKILGTNEEINLKMFLPSIYFGFVIVRLGSELVDGGDRQTRFK